MPDGADLVRQAGAAGWTDTFSSYYDQTVNLAFSLASRITGDAEQSSAACESAYVEAWEAGPSASPAAFEAALLERVRATALRIRRERAAEPVRSGEPRPAYAEGNVIRARLETVEPAARRAIELAYYGGVRVPEIAEILGQPVVAVRTAMRSALLQLGASAPGRERNQR